MSGATVAFVVFWSAVGGGTLLGLLARELGKLSRRRRSAAASPERPASPVIPLGARPARSAR